MKVRGEVFSGVLRGTPLVQKYYSRLVGLIGFSPHPGTLDIKMENELDITPFSTKFVEHFLHGDARRVVNACLAPVKIRKSNVHYALAQIRGDQKQIREDLDKLKENAEAVSVKIEVPSENWYECWAVQFRNGVYGNDTIELIAKDNIKRTLNVDDGDIVELELNEAPQKKKLIDMKRARKKFQEKVASKRPR